MTVDGVSQIENNAFADECAQVALPDADKAVEHRNGDEPEGQKV